MRVALTALFTVSLSCLAAQAQTVEEIQAIEAACAGQSSTLIQGKSLHVNKYEITADSEGTLSIREKGVLIRQIKTLDYKEYTACLTNLLGLIRPSQNTGLLPGDILDRIMMGEFGETHVSYVEKLIGPSIASEKFIDGDFESGLSYVNVSSYRSRPYRLAVIHDPDEKDIVRGVSIEVQDELTERSPAILLDGYWNGNVFKPGAVLGRSTVAQSLTDEWDTCRYTTNDGVWNNRDPLFFCKKMGGSRADGWINQKIIVNDYYDEKYKYDAYDLFRAIMFLEDNSELVHMDYEEYADIANYVGKVGEDHKDTVIASLEERIRVQMQSARIVGVEVFDDLSGGTLEDIASTDQFYREDTSQSQ